MLRVREGNMFFVCMTVGLVILASKYRDNVLRSVKRFYHGVLVNDDKSNDDKKKIKIHSDKIILADSPEKCDYAVRCIRCNSSDGLLGFDCEWVDEGPVSLLQLATFNGVCALFRLNKIGYVPPGLEELLSSRRVLKVGVASFEDGRKLNKDFGCRVFGTVDLRVLASRFGVPSPKSLAALSLRYLGIELDKVSEVRCGNWDADVLTNEQIKYAACDALASVLIYYEILQRARAKRTLWEGFVSSVKSIWETDEDASFHGLPSGVIDARFKARREDVIFKKVNSVSNKNNNDNNNNNNNSNRKNSVPTRNKPLYHNCYLEAPDGDSLCTCDRKKAEWYVAKGLGDVVRLEPFTVRLKFEPSGRALGEVGRYYTQIKVNQCVVCGSTDKFVRKNVVPREYRKYFPLVMKAHQSHDVLLLCPPCHEISNSCDIRLRRQLAELCEAPLSGPKSHVREEYPPGWRKLRSAVKALREESSLPVIRRAELESYVMGMTGLRELTLDALEKMDKQLKSEPIPAAPSSSRSRCLPHGIKVVEYFEKTDGGLVELEKLWREHFLKSMRPRYLPKLWSVSHNQERLAIRQTQNRIEPQDARIAGLPVTRERTKI